MTFKEYINGNPFRWAMGDNGSAIVQMELNTTKGAGDSIKFSFVDAYDPSKVKRGDQELEGNEQDFNFLSDSVTVDYVRVAGKVEQKKLVEARTPIEVVGLLRPQIIDQQTQVLRDEIIDEAGSGLVTVSDAGAATLVSGATSPNRTRCLFGAADSNYNATLATGLANVDSTADKMTLAIAKLARKKALNVAVYSNDVSTRKIRPYRMVQANGSITETYVMFLDPVAASDLQADADFKELRDDARANQLSAPYFDGSKYLGSAAGIMFYEIEELARLSTDSGASSVRVAHNFLCGAQAWGIGIAEAGEFGQRDMDYKMHVGVAHTIIRGTKLLKFDGVENGLVHVFTSGAA